MMWTTCLRAPSSHRRDRLGDRDRAFELQRRPRRRAPRRARAAAPRSSVSPPSTPPPGSSQYSLPGFSWRQSSTRPCQRRSAETRMRGRLHQCRDEPKPRTPRSLSGSSSTSTSSTSGTGEHDELGDAHPRLDDERLARVGVEQRDAQLAAVAGVDEPRRVDDRDPVLRREPRARLHEPRVPVRDRDGEPGRRRALARPARARRARTRRGRGPRRRRRRAPARPRPGAAAGSRARSCGLAARRRRPSATRNAREPRQVAPRQPRDRRAPPPACPRAPRSARRARTAPRARAPSSYGTSRRTRSQRSSNCSREPRRQLLEPLPGHAPRPAARSGNRFASRRRPSASTRSILFSTSSTGSSAAPISSQHLLDRGAPARPARRPRPSASTTCSTSRPRASPRASPRSPRRAECGRRRMKPTVSVTR